MPLIFSSEPEVLVNIVDADVGACGRVVMIGRKRQLADCSIVVGTEMSRYLREAWLRILLWSSRMRPY